MADSSPVIPFTIYLQPAAPEKPVSGAACNGCGVCCSVAPCPLGQVLTRKRRGPCAMLRWHADRHVYQCGAVTDAGPVLTGVMPRMFAGLAPLLAPAFARLARRWIAAGRGCDSDLLAESVIRDARA